MNDSAVISADAAATGGAPPKARLDPWRRFKPGAWQKTIDVRDFIVRNTRSYYGDESFLERPTARTRAVFRALQPCFRDEVRKGVLDVDAKASPSMRSHAPGYIDRANEVIVGLPDACGRGPIIGDYRRVALYGIDRLLEARHAERAHIDDMWPSDEIIREREELADQMRALKELKAMAESYGFDIGAPATTAREAVQWVYFAYLGAIEEANGAAMSIGSVSTFLDAYIERDIDEGRIAESRAQELIDQLVIKLRIVRFLRTPYDDALLTGDPCRATECIGGMDLDGNTLVTRTSFRMLHTLTNLGPAPEPNITVKWSQQLPHAFKRYCIKVSRDSSSIQYENDDLMRPHWGDDYAMDKVREHPTYRNARHTQPVPTITSKVACGKATGNTRLGEDEGLDQAVRAFDMQFRQGVSR